MQPTLAATPGSTLEAALLSSRDDPAAWGVYADFLEGTGDGRAELMAVMLAREANPTKELAQAELELLTAHRETLLPASMRGARIFSAEDAAADVVWRRGFLHEVELSQLTQLEELLVHPSAALLDTVTLAGPLASTAEQWNELLARVSGRRLPWRRLILGVVPPGAGLGALLAATPRLEALHVSTRPPAVLDLTGLALPSLRELTVHLAGGDELPRLGAVPSLQRLVLREPRDAAGLVMKAAAQPWFAGLQVLDVDNVADLRAIVPLARAGGPRLVLGRIRTGGLDAPPNLPGLVTHLEPDPDQDGLETAFLLFEGGVTEELRRTLINAVRSAGAAGFVAHFAPLELAGRKLTACRFHGEDTILLRPHALAERLLDHPANHLRQIACVAISGSNGVTRGFLWTPRKEARRASLRPHLENGFHTRHQLVRRLVSDWLGIDPGLGVLDEVLLTLDEAPPAVLAGPANLLELPVLTELAAIELPPEDEEDDDSGEYALEVDGSSPDEETAWSIPAPAPSLGLILREEAADAQVTPETDEEDDEPIVDAASADLVEVLLEGPVDVEEEEWGAPLAIDHSGEPDFMELDAFAPFIEATCAHCFASATATCAGCGADVCTRCGTAAIAGEAGEERVLCRDCSGPAAS